MREIKFRFFDTTSKKMYGMKDIQEYDLEQMHRFASTDDPYTKVMQYTGLKDKNGVEIYEGDIVHWGHMEGYTECTPRKAVVKLYPALCFETFNLGEYNHTFHYGSFAYAGFIDRAMEVIGNIHESPDLL